MPPPLVSHDPNLRAPRFFYALVPDAPSARRLARAGSGVARACRGRALDAPDLHLTLAFVGSRASADRAPLVPPELALPEALLGRADWPATQLDRLASFGRGIVWAGPTRTPVWLAELARELRACLRSAGIAFDEKPMRAHITLVRGAQRWDEEAPQPDFEPVAVASWHLALGWSRGRRDGPRYAWQPL